MLEMHLEKCAHRWQTKTDGGNITYFFPTHSTHFLTDEQASLFFYHELLCSVNGSLLTAMCLDRAACFSTLLFDHLADVFI